MLYVAFNIGFVICNAFCIYMLCNLLLDEPVNSKKALLYSGIIGLGIGIFYVNFADNTLVYMIGSLTVYYLSLKCFFRRGFVPQLFALALFYIAGALAELIFYFIYVLSMGISVMEIRRSVTLQIGPLLCSYVIVVLLIYGIKHIKTIFKMCKYMEYPPLFVFLGIMPIVVIVGYFVFLNELLSNVSRNTIILISTLSVFLSLMMFIAFIGLLDRQYKKSMEDEFNREYAYNMKMLLSDLREFRHDFNNMINGFKGCLIKGDIKKLKSYIGEMENEFMPANKNLYNVGFIQNPAVFGCILQKIDKLKDLKTEINILKEVTLDTILDSPTLCRMFGIIIDNAIEATELSKEKILHLNILEDEELVTVIVSNSFNGKINTDNILQSKKTGNDGGVGLYSLASILSKNKGILNSTYIDQNGLFTQQLTLPLKTKK